MSKVCQCGSDIKDRVYTNGRKVQVYSPKYCSRKCAYLFRKRPHGLIYNIVNKNVGWFKNLGGGIDERGYRRIHVGRGKYRREHRVVAEKLIGRKLLTDEVVHHINGIKTDNRPSNLQVMVKHLHDALHKGKKICQKY